MSESEVSKEDLTDPTDTSEESLPDAEEEDEVAEGESVEPAEEEDVEGDAEVYKDRWVRLAAEFDNYKKRTLRELSLIHI